MKTKILFLFFFNLLFFPLIIKALNNVYITNEQVLKDLKELVEEMNPIFQENQEKKDWSIKGPKSQFLQKLKTRGWKVLRSEDIIHYENPYELLEEASTIVAQAPEKKYLIRFKLNSRHGMKYIFLCSEDTCTIS